MKRGERDGDCAITLEGETEHHTQYAQLCSPEEDGINLFPRLYWIHKPIEYERVNHQEKPTEHRSVRMGVHHVLEIHPIQFNNVGESKGETHARGHKKIEEHRTEPVQSHGWWLGH